jgi:IS5 family transposase
MKTDGRLDRNFLLGQAGDAINALLAAAGHNLRLVLTALAAILSLTNLNTYSRRWR